MVSSALFGLPKKFWGKLDNNNTKPVGLTQCPFPGSMSGRRQKFFGGKNTFESVSSHKWRVNRKMLETPWPRQYRNKKDTTMDGKPILPG